MDGVVVEGRKRNWSVDLDPNGWIGWRMDDASKVEILVMALIPMNDLTRTLFKSERTERRSNF